MQPQNSRDREKIYRFLYEIWSEEFSRSMEGMNHEHRFMKDGLDKTAIHLAAIDWSGRIVGCVRINILSKTALSDTLKKYLKIKELVELFGSDKICYASHFAVAPEARGRTVASLLIAALYRLCLDKGVSVGISYCALQFVSIYSQLGYRQYAENFRLDAGVRVPIVHCLRDWNYLNEIKSPLVRLCAKEHDDKGATARMLVGQFPLLTDPIFPQTNVNHLWARLAHTTPDDKAARAFFYGLSGEEQKIVGRRMSEVVFSQGEYVYRRGETEQGMGVLLSGSLGVEVSAGGASRIVNVIHPGESFGEVSRLCNGRRTADLVALEKSQAFLLPSDFLERVCRASPDLGLKLTQRLLKTLAVRIVNLTDAVVCNEPIPEASQCKQPPFFQHSNTDTIKSRIESYQFKSLGDQEDEFKRLVTQATIGEDIELSVLKSIGLRDGAKVLDLGSGPGVTSSLIAKRLPQATVIGVEPEDLLRKKAEAFIIDQGLAERCHFLKGTGDRIPLADGMVDFSYARLLFQHIPNPLEVLSEMRRVTRQEGVVAILDVDDRTNIIHPAPAGLEELENLIASAQAEAGGDRHVGRKLLGYMTEAGLQNIRIDTIPISASTLGREAFFSIVFSFKRQVLERAGKFDEPTAALFFALEDLIKKPTTFAMTIVYVAHGIVP